MDGKRLVKLADPQSRGLRKVKKMTKDKKTGKLTLRSYWTRAEIHEGSLPESEIKTKLSEVEFASYKNLSNELPRINDLIDGSKTQLGKVNKSLSKFQGQMSSVDPDSDDYDELAEKVENFTDWQGELTETLAGLEDSKKEIERQIRELTSHVRQKKRFYPKPEKERSPVQDLSKKDIEKGLDQGTLPFDHRGYIADGSPLAQSELDAIDQLYDEKHHADRCKAKIQRTNPSITNQEAKSLAFYMEGDYKRINEVMRNDIGMSKDGDYLVVGGNYIDSIDSLPSSPAWTSVAVAKSAVQALDKLPVFSPESLESALLSEHKLNSYGRSQEERVRRVMDSDDWQVSRDSSGKIVAPEGKGYLLRHIDVPEENLEEFAKINSPGSVFRDDGFSSTAVPLRDHGGLLASFNAGSVVYKIDWKKDGTTKGRYVDHVKRALLEYEVLFPPRTEFKIKSVSLGDGSDFSIDAYREKVKILDETKRRRVPESSEEYRKAFDDAKLTIHIEEL